MEAKAVSRYVRVSPRKARIVLNQIRGKNVIAALETLRFTNRAVAEVVEKTLNSAIANAGQKGYSNPDNLVVKACFADEPLSAFVLALRALHLVSTNARVTLL